MATEKDIRHQDSVCTNESHLTHKWYYNLKYLLVGIVFGIVFVKAEIISWFRIQEMFRLQSFFMYGVIGSAVLTGMISVFIIKKFNINLWRADFWIWLGNDGCLSGTSFRTDWNRCIGCWSYFAECHFWNLGLWIFEG